MKRERFRGTVLEGHRGAAIEIPFDPAKRWEVPLSRFRQGRRGHEVQGSVNGLRFESFVVARARRFFVLVADELRAAAGLSIGDTVEVALEPRAMNPPARRGTSRRS